MSFDDDRRQTYLTANQLRALAEEVDSMRNAKVCVVEVDDANASLRVVPEDVAIELNLKIVLWCNTSDEDAKFKRDDILLTADKSITTKKGKSKSLDDFDAIFTSLSAVEKFVVPYYASMSSLVECELARSNFANTPSAVAVLHTPKSVSLVGTVNRRSLYVAVQNARGELDLEEF